MRRVGLLAAIAALAGGCQVVLGIEERVLVAAGGAGGAGQGGAGTGGAGTGGACAPGATEACYEGPIGTSGVGACEPGVRTCADDGSGFGACVGAVVPVAEDCATAADDDCDGDAPACTGEIVAAVAAGAAGDDEALAVAPVGDADVIVAGVADGAPRGDLVAGRAFVERRGAALDLVWSQPFEGGSTALLAAATGALGDVAVGGAIDGEATFAGGTVAGQGGLDAIVMKLEPTTGVPLWTALAGDAAHDQVVESVAVDRAGAVIAAGRFEGDLAFDAAHALASVPRSGFVVKLDAGGAVAWAVALRGSFLVRSLRVVVDASGDPVVAGTFAGSLVVGDRTLATTGLGDADGFVAWLDGATGSSRAAVQLGDAATQDVSALAIASGGDVVVGGSTAGTIALEGGSIPGAADGAAHGFVTRVASTGAMAWGVRLGDDGAQAVRGLAIDAAGSVVVAGRAAGTVTLGGDAVATPPGDPGSALVAKLGAAGEPRWARLLGDASLQRASAIAVAPSGRAVVVGGFAGVLAPASTASSGGLDAFVAALAP